MSRISLSDGRWFEAKDAELFEEATWWDGSNYISKETGSQWEHEELYRTRGGAWVRRWWSQWQGVGETYEVLDDGAACQWLIRNEEHKAAGKHFPGAAAQAEL